MNLPLSAVITNSRAYLSEKWHYLTILNGRTTVQVHVESKELSLTTHQKFKITDAPDMGFGGVTLANGGVSIGIFLR